jgi:hypothetical protein
MQSHGAAAAIQDANDANSVQGVPYVESIVEATPGDASSQEIACSSGHQLPKRRQLL